MDNGGTTITTTSEEARIPGNTASETPSPPDQRPLPISRSKSVSACAPRPVFGATLHPSPKIPNTRDAHTPTNTPKAPYRRVVGTFPAAANPWADTM